MIESLDTNFNEIHKEFVMNIYKITAEVILNHKEKLLPKTSINTLITFSKKGYADDNLYDEIEEKLEGENISVDDRVKIMKYYLKINRVNAFFERNCNKLLNQVEYCLPYYEDIKAISQNDISVSQSLINLANILEEKQSNNTI